MTNNNFPYIHHHHEKDSPFVLLMAYPPVISDQVSFSVSVIG